MKMSDCDFKSAGGTGWIAAPLVAVLLASAFAIPLADNSVQCVVTSPPYFGLRKYTGNQELVWGGQAGCPHEWPENGTRKQSPQRDHAPDGSFGATRGVEKSSAGMAYQASLGNTCLRCDAWRGAFGQEPTVELYVQHTVEILQEVRRVLRPDGVVFWNVADSYLDKNLCLIPQLVAIAAKKDGWWVRSTIPWWEDPEKAGVLLWVKPNPMPESVRDRPTDAYETILMLTKSERYCWDQHATMEPTNDLKTKPRRFRKGDASQTLRNDEGNGYQPRGTRNPRNVWTFPVGSYKGAHFATFPVELPLRCITAACPAKGRCRFCGTPWRRVMRVTKADEVVTRESVGWTPGCKCRGQRGITKPCLVLDPFAGAGTTGLAASQLKQDCVLLDISRDYCRMMTERLKGKKHDKADKAKVEIDSGDPLRHPGLPDDCADRGVGIVPPPQGLPAPDSDAVLGA
jgi:site-specific DNA-methyltransferase (adenine-specific)